MAFKAVGHRIIIKPDPVEEVSKGGIVIAVDQKLEKGATVTGTIVDIGEDAWVAFKPKTEFAGLKIGDHVYIAKYAGKWIVDTGTKEEFLVINDEDIVCKILE